MTEFFTSQYRVKLYYAITDHLPTYEDRGRIASLPFLDEYLRKRYGRLQLAEGDEVDEIIRHFILAAPEDELLDVIELTPLAHYGAAITNIPPDRRDEYEAAVNEEAAGIAHALNKFLERVIGHPARFVFDPEYRFVRAGTAMEKLTHFSKLPNLASLTADLGRLLSAGELGAVLYLDLDHFGEVNNTLGHDAGNDCLDKAVAMISHAILKKGNLYRYGGDEFVVVLPNFTAQEAGATAERIRSAIEQAQLGVSPFVTASIGVVDSNTTSRAEELIKAADAAMYRSKQQRNKVTIA